MTGCSFSRELNSNGQVVTGSKKTDIFEQTSQCHHNADDH